MTNEELQAIFENQRRTQASYRHVFHICAGTGCLSSHSSEVRSAFEKYILTVGLKEQILVRQSGCMGLCAAGPILTVQPEGLIFCRVAPQDAAAIIAHVENDRPFDKLLSPDLPFFNRQQKNALGNSGKIDPLQIEDYISWGGYKALLKALTELAPVSIIQEVARSGLRGRGGSGYPTGLKWSTIAKATDKQKFVVCNANEGDPGAFMDRSILESDPHIVLEGMTIAAYAVGAQRGYIYIRAEYPLAIERLQKAIESAENLNLLGNQICDSNFNFHVEIRQGAGAFVSGEETALIKSIEGKRAIPTPRPPYPAQTGLWGHPTLINNVETLANIPAILLKGADWFSQTGTPKSKGTKVFALSGMVKNTGLIEVPMGITLREIIFDIGGGIPDGQTFKAVQSGGPSGGFIPAHRLDTPLDYESLEALGSIMGSGGMIVLDNSADMVEIARYFMEFSKNESCGKCVPCRVGTAQIHHLLCRFTAGQATKEDLQTLEDLCMLVKNTSLCGLGRAAPNPVISSLKYFRQEYLDKIRDSRYIPEQSA